MDRNTTIKISTQALTILKTREVKLFLFKSKRICPKSRTKDFALYKNLKLTGAELNFQTKAKNKHYPITANANDDNGLKYHISEM